MLTVCKFTRLAACPPIINGRTNLQTVDDDEINGINLIIVVRERNVQISSHCKICHTVKYFSELVSASRRSMILDACG